MEVAFLFANKVALLADAEDGNAGVSLLRLSPSTSGGCIFIVESPDTHARRGWLVCWKPLGSAPTCGVLSPPSAGSGAEFPQPLGVLMADSSHLSSSLGGSSPSP